jgi:hypothetical protein
VNAQYGVRTWRMLLMSPMTVIEVSAVCVCISVLASCSAAMKSASLCMSYLWRLF